MAIEVHIPVLAGPVCDFLDPKPGGIYVDATIGNAGHALALFGREPVARLIGLDQDREILEIARLRLQAYASQVELHENNFAELPPILERRGLQVDGILCDLGVSSLQLDGAGRGFSFQQPGPLDMRMSAGGGSLADRLRQVRLPELTKVLREFGEERLAPKIARRILEAFHAGLLRTTADLAQIAWQSYPPSARYRHPHPATRTFQALRIWVNDELEVLKKLVAQVPPFLKPEGRLVILSYHSLEDRIVKQGFRKWAKETGGFEILTKKPVIPTDEEMAQNRRSRSAKLRALKRNR